MFSQTLQDEFNEQIKHELYSAYLYLSMPAHCASAAKSKSFQKSDRPGKIAWAV